MSAAAVPEFAVDVEYLNGYTHQYSLFVIDRAASTRWTLSYADFFNCISSETDAGKSLRETLTRVLREDSLRAYFWETPPFTASSIGKQFKFVLVDAPSLVSKHGSPLSFSEHFRNAGAADVVAFLNLGRNALLVAPCQRDGISHNSYAHFANFVREAPASQIENLWKKVGESALSLASDKPYWLSTAGQGVPWLHVRFDTRPKYYTHTPYKSTVGLT